MEIKKYKVTFWPDDPKRKIIIDENNFYPNYFIGLNGFLYENYGTINEPLWESVFDADYIIEEINNEKNVY